MAQRDDRSLNGQFLVEVSCSNSVESDNIHSFWICVATIAREVNRYTSQADKSDK